MSKYGVWAYCYFGDVEASSQGEAKALGVKLVNEGVDGPEPARVESIDVYEIEEGAGGVCC